MSRGGKSGRGTWSITRKVTLLYVISTSAMLAVAIAFLYWMLRKDLVREDNQFLANKINVLRVILRERPEDPKALIEEVVWERGGSPSVEYFARVLDRSGHTLIEAPHMAANLPASLFPKPVEITELPGAGKRWRSPDGGAYLMMAAWAGLGKSPHKQRVIQVAMDDSYEDVLFADYGRKVILVLLLGMMFSAGAGILIARKGMAPLAEITRTLHRITSAQLHERIGSTEWPRELATLASSFDQMLGRLEDSFARLAQFSADLAHELRTPLNNLMGEAEVALSRNRAPDDYRQVLESSLEECARLSRVIDNLLFLARSESAETHIERRLLDARKEIEAVREFHDAVAQEQSVDIRCQGHGFIHGDPGLFRRAMSNLLANALQYTERGGKIVVHVKQAEDHTLEVCVQDTGYGIAPEHLPRIFDRFYRADRARSQYPDGTGLGLAIVKSIMDLHGGSVTVQSDLDKGTTVTLHFPISPV